jgi:hypothetical protein
MPVGLRLTIAAEAVFATRLPGPRRLDLVPIPLGRYTSDAGTGKVPIYGVSEHAKRPAVSAVSARRRWWILRYLRKVAARWARPPSGLKEAKVRAWQLPGLNTRSSKRPAWANGPALFEALGSTKPKHAFEPACSDADRRAGQTFDFVPVLCYPQNTSLSFSEEGLAVGGA